MAKIPGFVAGGLWIGVSRYDSAVSQPRPPQAVRPYRPPERARFVAYMSVGVMVMVAVIMMAQGRLSWTWMFPFTATAVTVYSSVRVRRTTTMRQGVRWSLVQIIFAIGALCLLVLPARY